MHRRSPQQLAEDLMDKPWDTLNDLEKEVLENIAGCNATGIDHEKQATPSFGARLADRVAAVGGSWGFIIAFACVLASWMIINSAIPAKLGIRFDPYPYIFLNLMLSMLAAIQAPIIMMSQNRSADRDREAAKHDYQVNLRAELEIILLHEKLEHMMGELDAIKTAVGVKDDMK